MYVIVVEDIAGMTLGPGGISYRIAKAGRPGKMPIKVNLEELAWKNRDARRAIIQVSECIIQFTIYSPIGNVTGPFMTVKYDQYYASSYGPEARTYEDSAHIAIVHRSDLQNNPVVDLTKFRFKT
jgi:hypothetical protein